MGNHWVERRTRLYWCRMARCLVEIGWKDGRPVCFYGHTGLGNVCDEPDRNFISMPFEPVLWRVYGLLKRHRMIK